MNLAGLPDPAQRFTAARKAQIVHSVEGGRLTLAQAGRAYNLSEEEFTSWRQALLAHGRGALKISRLQHYPRQVTV